MKKTKEEIKQIWEKLPQKEKNKIIELGKLIFDISDCLKEVEPLINIKNKGLRGALALGYLEQAYDSEDLRKAIKFIKKRFEK